MSGGAPAPGGRWWEAGLGVVLGLVLTAGLPLGMLWIVGDSASIPVLVAAPLGVALIPLVVGIVLLRLRSRTRAFAQGLVIAAGIVMVVDTVACFALANVASQM